MICKLKLFTSIKSKDIRAKGLALRPAPKKLAKEDGEHLMHELQKRDLSKTTKGQKEYSGSYHDKVKNILSEIGELEGMKPNTEYQRLDVIWRSRDDSVPSHVFEVHISGEIYKELTKLKNANYKWNSRIFYVTPEAQVDAVQKCIRESFGEIQNKVKVVTCERVEEWYQTAKKNRQILDMFGLND